MHVMMTADTLGGVWTYTQELVRGLISRGNHVTLVSVGDIPRLEQTSWMADLSGLDYRPSAYRLEWMQNAEVDIRNSREHIESIIREVKPDIFHSNQYCYGDLSCETPKLVVAHSDIVSWWVAVHGHEPENTPWVSWYRDTVTRGLRGAEVVVTPSYWMGEAISQHYVPYAPIRVIYNGRAPDLFEPNLAKENFALSVGRVWDAGKQMDLLTSREYQIPVRIAGRESEPGSLATRGTSAQFCGERSQEDLRALYARAPIYVATSRYEPFGLAPLEAALSRCALIVNDIPSLRELWGDSAYYFRKNDADDLAEAIRILHQYPGLRKLYGDLAFARARSNFAADTMVNQYIELYEAVISREKAA